ncbi:MAG: ABC transporter substrate-binding protein, partial [Deltaproteobacteria bacterium]|nr:ABC transporter substrate-binding protein [Deltaproteobacteria bacterium]
MHLTFAHYRNRFCMYRTYYALAEGILKPDGLTISVIEVSDPPSHEQEEMLIRGDVQVANLYLANFLRRKAEGALIIGLATEWKSTLKGNGIFVLKDGPVHRPQDLAGRVLGSHQGPHAIHRFMLKRLYRIPEGTLTWVAHPQEELLGALKQRKVDAVVLIDQFFFRGEQDPEVRCLYTDGDGWKALYGFSEMIKHMIAIREPLVKDHPELKDKLLGAFKASFAYSESHLDDIADKFIERYGGNKEALLASA